MKRRSMLFPFVCFLLSLCLLAAALNTRIVRLETRTVRVNGLKTALNGTRILFLSDLKITNDREAHHAAQLVKRLCRSGPDMLILGGDLSAKRGNAQTKQIEQAVELFLSETREVFCAGGKYLVYGDEDLLISDRALASSGFAMLSNTIMRVSFHGSALAIAGYAAESREIARNLELKDDRTGALIVVTHDAANARLVPLPSNTDEKGNPYADLILCGMTGGRDAEFTPETESVLGIPTVVSRGIGGSFPLRFLSYPTAYMITLTNGG